MSQPLLDYLAKSENQNNVNKSEADTVNDDGADKSIASDKDGSGEDGVTDLENPSTNVSAVDDG
jgi:hypothetical protein